LTQAGASVAGVPQYLHVRAATGLPGAHQVEEPATATLGVRHR
jgi:hypothetical protein